MKISTGKLEHLRPCNDNNYPTMAWLNWIVLAVFATGKHILYQHMHLNCPLHFLVAGQSIFSLSSHQYRSTSIPLLHLSSYPTPPQPPHPTPNGNKASWSCISVTLSPPSPFVSLAFVPYRMLKSAIVEYLLFSTPSISLETSSPSFSPLLIPSVLSFQLSASDSIPPAVISSPSSSSSSLRAFYLSLYRFLNPRSLSFFSSHPSDYASLTLSRRRVWSVTTLSASHPLAQFPPPPFSILSPFSVVSLPVPGETVT